MITYLTLALILAFLVISGLAVRLVQQRRELAELRASLELKADQVAALSHELRTPLSIIVGSAGVLSESAGSLTPRQLGFVRSIAFNTTRVSTLAETLLIQARLEAGLFTLSLQRTELRSFIRNAVTELRRVLDRDIAIDTPGPPLYLDIDPHLLRQVVDNLVLNAARADQGSRELIVSLRNAEHAIIVSVHDRGKGMTEAARRRLFGRFATMTTNGAGIGLYVSRKIIELHGGTILVDTLTGLGSSFLIVLPKQPREPGSTTANRLWPRRRPTVESAPRPAG